MISRRLNFNVLCVIEPELKCYWNPTSGKFDFSNHHALITLTRALIKLDLGYSIQLSETLLCPNYFNRLDYVLFLEKLISLVPDSADLPVFGLDVGTSQSCIYPLLCTRYISNISKMIATDIVPELIEAAKFNVSSNGLSSLIELSLVDPKENSYSPFVSQILNYKHKPIVFTMCNPPFYASELDMNTSRRIKNKYTKPRTRGHNSELITSGGDYNFIMKLLKDSEDFADTVTWFTSLIGNHYTLKRLIPYLKANENRITFGVHRFKSGSFTTRWILFWSYKQEIKPPPELFNYCNKYLNANKFLRPIQTKQEDNALLRSLVLGKLLSLPYISLHIRDVISIRLPGNVFSRAYRRSNMLKSDGSTYIFELSIECREIIWRKGLDYKVFESFCNMINSL